MDIFEKSNAEVAVKKLFWIAFSILALLYAISFVYVHASGSIDQIPPEKDYGEMQQVIDYFKETIGGQNYKSLLRNGYDISFVDSLDEADDYGRINYISRRIEIKKSSEEVMKTAILHEYGHYIAHEKHLSLKEVFIVSYNTIPKESVDLGNDVLTEYMYSSLDEFIASSIDIYYSYPELLKENYPDIYEYLDSTIKKETSSENTSGDVS